MAGRQYMRSAGVVFGAFSIENLRDDGLSIDFKVTRSTGSTPDRGVVGIMNLSALSRGLIKAQFDEVVDQRKFIIGNPLFSDSQKGAALSVLEKTLGRVLLFAGYDGIPELLFLGSVVKVRPSMRQGMDFRTEIEIGDGFVNLRDGYLSQAFGATSVENLRQAWLIAKGIEESADAKIAVSAVAPNAVITDFGPEEGIVVAGGDGTELIDEIMDLYGLQWWIKDGQFQASARGSTINEPAILLQEGIDLLQNSSPEGFGDFMGRALLNPKIFPGRGLKVLDKRGLEIGSQGYRIDKVIYTGNTAGAAWYADIEARSISLAIATNAAAFTAAEVEAIKRKGLLVAELEASF